MVKLIAMLGYIYLWINFIPHTLIPSFTPHLNIEVTLFRIMIGIRKILYVVTMSYFWGYR